MFRAQKAINKYEKIPYTCLSFHTHTGPPMIAGEGVHFVVFCSILTWAGFNSLCFRGLRGWDQRFMKWTSKSMPWNPYPTRGWYIMCTFTAISFTLKTAFWSMLLSLLALYPPFGHSEDQRHNNCGVKRQPGMSLWSTWFEELSEALKDMSMRYGIWINLARTMHFRMSSSKQLRRMTWRSVLKRKETRSIQKPISMFVLIHARSGALILFFFVNTWKIQFPKVIESTARHEHPFFSDHWSCALCRNRYHERAERRAIRGGRLQ